MSMFFEDDPSENPAEHLSHNAERVLKEMALSGSSEGSGVARILNLIAMNGPDAAADENLIACAKEVRDWAQSFIDQIKPEEGGEVP